MLHIIRVYRVKLCIPHGDWYINHILYIESSYSIEEERFDLYRDCIDVIVVPFVVLECLYLEYLIGHCERFCNSYSNAPWLPSRVLNDMIRVYSGSIYFWCVSRSSFMVKCNTRILILAYFLTSTIVMALDLKIFSWAVFFFPS